MALKFICAVALSLVGTSHLLAELPDRIVTQIQSATVLVKVSLKDKPFSTGSGFIVARTRSSADIISNARVVDGPARGKRDITVVVRSGTAGAEELPCKVVAIDVERDLSLLRIDGSGLPDPINMSSSRQFRRSQAVSVFGFPFGGKKVEKVDTPEIVITQGIVSSIRRDEAGQIRRVQIDGLINPGNSGGPIVDSSGYLLGVAVAKMSFTKIGFGIPPSDVHEMIRGRIRKLKAEEVSNNGKAIAVSFTAELCDPLSNIKKISVVVARSSTTAVRGSGRQTREERVVLDVRGDRAYGKLVLRSSEAKNEVYSYYGVCIFRKGQSAKTRPQQFRALFATGTEAAAEAGDWLGQ